RRVSGDRHAHQRLPAGRRATRMCRGGEEHAESPVSPRRGASIGRREPRASPGRADRHPAAPPMRRPSGCNAGFTLIEMLVAVALMGLMGVVCWRGLAFVANQRSAIEDEAVELAQIVRAFAQIERDLAERLPDIAAPARATTPELPLAVSVVTGENGNAE